ncbi:hypothetical protein [Streptacidiphilus jiangxiensis]|nr:hypothetical protein [Streptacidiphilus jiangxiensis]
MTNQIDLVEGDIHKLRGLTARGDSTYYVDLGRGQRWRPHPDAVA